MPPAPAKCGERAIVTARELAQKIATCEMPHAFRLANGTRILVREDANYTGNVTIVGHDGYWHSNLCKKDDEEFIVDYVTSQSNIL